jgi:cytochrome c oxidase subunit II
MKRVLLAVAATVVVGCSWRQGALQPLGPKATAIAALGAVYFWISFAVFLLLMVGSLWAVIRGMARARAAETDTPALSPAGEERLTRAVAASTIVSAVLLAVMLVTSVATGRSLADFAAAEPLRIKVRAHQWWWYIEYPGRHPDEQVVTANELHVPAGVPVELELSSADVIHSFWIPNLDGKHDLIPSHTIKTLILAEVPGAYSGRCAEFCGYQHAHMDILLVAHPPGEFEAWLAGQLQPASEPQTPQEQRGRELVESSACASCHTVSGTKALGGVGPDLSHLASRRTLATGAAELTAKSLRDWIENPQRLKPGSQMPAIALSDPDRAAVVAYLETLR